MRSCPTSGPTNGPMSSAGEGLSRGSVGVVGCGWLGFALAQHLLAAGYEVYGTTTTAAKVPELTAAGIRAEVLRLSPKPVFAKAAPTEDTVSEAAAVWRADQLVLNVPPGRTDASRRAYPAQVLAAVLAYRRTQPAGRIVFCSSTSVYGAAEGLVTVDTPLKDSSPRAVCMALAESQVRSQSQRPHAILRLAGLYGGDRHPGRTLAGRRDIPNGDAPTNLVSRERVIARIRHYLDLPFFTTALENVVDPEHPSKRERYVAFARAHGLPEPTFLPGGAGGKVVA